MSETAMRVAYKRGRLKKATRQRLAELANGLREMTQAEREQQELRDRSKLYRVAWGIQDLADLAHGGQIDARTAMDTARFLMRELSPWAALNYPTPYEVKIEVGDPKSMETCQPIDIRANDYLFANVVYLINNAIAFWVCGYYNDEMAIGLLYDYATLALSAYSGRTKPLARPGVCLPPGWEVTA